MQISDNAPGGKVEYRRALAASFLFKFFVQVACKLEADTQVGARHPPLLLWGPHETTLLL